MAVWSLNSKFKRNKLWKMWTQSHQTTTWWITSYLCPCKLDKMKLLFLICLLELWTGCVYSAVRISIVRISFYFHLTNPHLATSNLQWMQNDSMFGRYSSEVISWYPGDIPWFGHYIGSSNSAREDCRRHRFCVDWKQVYLGFEVLCQNKQLQHQRNVSKVWRQNFFCCECFRGYASTTRLSNHARKLYSSTINIELNVCKYFPNRRLCFDNQLQICLDRQKN